VRAIVDGSEVVIWPPPAGLRQGAGVVPVVHQNAAGLGRLVGSLASWIVLDLALGMLGLFVF